MSDSSEGYNVVTKTLVGFSKGVYTWTTYASKADFESHRQTLKDQGWYEVVAEGITDKQAIDICRSPEANQSALSALLTGGFYAKD